MGHTAGVDDVRMRSGRRHRGFVAGTIAAVLVAVASLVTAFATERLGPDDVLAVTAMVAFTFVGGLILDRRPGQPVGRMTLAIGLLWSTAVILRLIATLVDVQPGGLPAWGAAMAVIAASMFTVAIAVAPPALIVRFPSGTATGVTRRAQDLLLAGVGASMFLSALKPGPLGEVTRVPLAAVIPRYGWVEGIANPLGVAWIGNEGDWPLSIVAGLGCIVLWLTALFGLVGRYRTGEPRTRAQIRWFAAAVLTNLALLMVVIFGGAGGTAGDLAWAAWILSYTLPPLAIAIAILRYHLYDIDRILDQTLVYAAVTALLGSIYVVFVIALQSPLAALTGLNQAGVAVSTLIVAALFTPVRSRVQRGLDRRFHRARYDAEQVVAGLAARLRDEVGERRLRTDILDTVHRSVEPATATLWLRPKSPE